MKPLIAVLLVAVAACALPRPATVPPQPPQMDNALAPPPLNRPAPLPEDFLSGYILPRMLIPQYIGYDSSPVVEQPSRDDWLNKEIERIRAMKEVNEAEPYEKDLEIVRDTYLSRIYAPIRPQEGPFVEETVSEHNEHPLPGAFGPPEYGSLKPQPEKESAENVHAPTNSEQKKDFALTPFDRGFFELATKLDNSAITERVEKQNEIDKKNEEQPLAQRQIRQNPNLSKTKNLVSGDLDRLRAGLSTDEYGSTEKPRSIHVLEPAPVDPADSIYGIAIIAAVAAALALAIIGFAFGWYTMTKRAKAAADVDYPAYGVTGPTVDMSGDRRLAHSAHMYHYQHQKQQIIAMERNGLEQRNGSISDPESEEENEEGDYTVYECPGFATTGEMEVKNPLFAEDPTPATPGKVELVKPQPKE